MRLSYYVYGIKRNGKIIYIGKGSGNRVFVSLFNHNGDDYIKFIENVSEEEAYQYEKMLINSFREAGIKLHNKKKR